VAPPKPATTGFLDFVSIQEDVAGEAKAEEAGAEPVQEATVVEETSLKAADFGFGADDGSSAASSSAPSSPRGDGGARAGSKGSKGSASVPASSPAAAGVSAQVENLGSDAASPSHSPSPATKSEGGRGGGATELGASYKDKHEGLTMQQRLANLEFSDDEDEDEDDPLGLKKKG